MTRRAGGFRLASSYIVGGVEMAAERESQAELEREIAALIRERLPQAAGCDIAVDIIENNGGGPGETRIRFTPSAGGGGDKFDPTKEKARRLEVEPSDEPSPLIYPEGGEESLRWRKSDFNPVKIRGKPLSETVIEERRNARY